MSRGRSIEHRFLVCRPFRDPVPWRPLTSTDETGHDVVYIGRALAAAVELLGDCTPLTFVLTWNLHELPETGRHVVAIVQGDEDAQIPRWSNDVLVTFKCYGTCPHWMPLLPRPGVVEALELLHFLRRVVLWLPGGWSRAWRSGQPWRGRPPIFPIPLGFYNQDDRPLISFGERLWSVSFAGSGLEPIPSRRWRARLGTPKERARAQMHEALSRLARTMPDEPIAAVSQPVFPNLYPGQDSAARQLTSSYSDLLAQTRLCLVPRGNSPETFRFFEALRAGCIPICDSLPDHWFYRGAPVVSVRRWNELSSVLAPLLADPVATEQLHRASVEWWQSRCSEEAVGRYMADRISSQLHHLQSPARAKGGVVVDHVG